jgi:Flp pilus assembly protein TadG
MLLRRHEISVMPAFAQRVASGLLRRTSARFARRFMRARSGAAAVEFGLVAIPFLALTFAIVETAMLFFATQSLEAAVADASRQILTGQAQTAGYNTGASFKQNVVCTYLRTGVTLFDCSKVVVDVQNFSTFASATPSTPLTGGALDPNKAQFNAGGPGCIEVVSFYYEWPLYVTQLGFDMSNFGAGKRLLVSTAVFRNEPYGPTGAC